jgi:hypothetical protein
MFCQNVGDWASHKPVNTEATIRYLLASVGIHLDEKKSDDGGDTKSPKLKKSCGSEKGGVKANGTSSSTTHSITSESRTEEDGDEEEEEESDHGGDLLNKSEEVGGGGGGETKGSEDEAESVEVNSLRAQVVFLACWAKVKGYWFPW